MILEKAYLLVSRLVLIVLVIFFITTFLFLTISSYHYTVDASQKETRFKTNEAIFKVRDESSLLVPLAAYESSYHPVRSTFIHSFYTTPNKNLQQEFLCRLKLSSHCNMRYASEVVDTFWIVSPIYSPYQDNTKLRYLLHENFQNYVASIGMTACTLEAIREDRDQKYLITRPDREPYEIQTYYYDDIYIRENMLNIAAQKIKKYADWEYIGWIDAHHMFDNVYWWEDAIIDMEKYASVQLFRILHWLTDTNSTKWSRQGAMYASNTRRIVEYQAAPYFGNAYSIRRELYDKIGDIFDRGIGGCCDCAYVKASLDNYTTFDYMKTWPHYTEQFYTWINNTQKIFQGKRQGVRGDIYHLPHETNLVYFNLMEYFDESGFDLYKDIEMDVNGTFRLKNPDVKQKIEFYGYYANYKTRIIVGIVMAAIVVVGCCAFGLHKHLEKKSLTHKKLSKNEL